MDGDEQKAIWYVLRDLLEEGMRWRRDHAYGGTTDIANVFTPLDERKLQSHMRHGRSGQFEQGEAIQVKPPARAGHVSALSCKWNFEDGCADCWFHLGIWLSGGQFVGFRFEPPEQGDNHNYYHSQPCRTMGFRDEPIAGALEVPERNPTWPLPANSSLELLLCLVISIHGMVGLRKIKDGVYTDAAKRKNKRLREALDKVLRLQPRSTD